MIFWVWNWLLSNISHYINWHFFIDMTIGLGLEIDVAFGQSSQLGLMHSLAFKISHGMVYILTNHIHLQLPPSTCGFYACEWYFFFGMKCFTMLYFMINISNPERKSQDGRVLHEWLLGRTRAQPIYLGLFQPSVSSYLHCCDEVWNLCGT